MQNNGKRASLAPVAVLCLFVLAVASGCATVVQDAAVKALESRSTEDQVTDAKVYTSILDRLSQKDKGLLLDVSADVWEQRVMLTGVLDNEATIKEVERLVKGDNRVKTIYNEIKFVSATEKEKRRKDKESGGDKNETSNDFWLETKIKAQLLTNTKISSVNYRWRSVLNNVYIIGKVADTSERDLVLKTIGGVKGVKGVKDFITVVRAEAYPY